MGDEVIFSPVQAENRWGRAASLVVPLVVSLRPWQWAKNSVVLLPLVFTIDQDLRGRDFDSALDLAGRALAGFAVFCIMSSSVYLINDILDRRRDIIHPKKRNRPIPSGALSVRVAFWTAVTFALLSLTAAMALNSGFGIITGLYFVMNLSYSVYFKRVVVLDLLLVAGGYVVRLAAGTLLLETATSPWLYTTIGLGALVIVLSKRRSEVLGAGERASAQRPVPRRPAERRRRARSRSPPAPQHTGRGIQLSALPDPLSAVSPTESIYRRRSRSMVSCTSPPGSMSTIRGSIRANP